MHKVLHSILALFILAACSHPGERADYVLTWKGDGIGVTVTVQSAADTVLFTYASDAGGMTDQMSWFQDFTVEHGSVTVDSLSRDITIVPDKGTAKFSYVVRCTLPEGYGSPGGCLMDVFRPDIDKNMLFSRTENIFVVPKGEEDIPVSVEWESVPPYPVFCLYNAGKGTDRFEGMSDVLSFSVMAGDPLLTVDSVMVRGNMHYLVTALRKETELNKRQLKDYFRAFYGTVSSFWEEEYSGPYSMLLFPFRNNTWEGTGNGFTNGFVSRYDATADTVLTTMRRDLFTHEIGHKWLNNGTVWFAEGFDEMQTAYQLVASGVEDPSYFATYFNTALSGLFFNPYRNVPDEQAEEKFWEDGNYIWLLYWRGFSYAFHLAGVYEKETGEPNAWKPMMKAVKPFLEDFSADKFLEAMSTLMDRERLENDYKKYILDGTDFDFFQEDLPSGCRIVYRPDGVPQLEVTDTLLFAKHFQ